MRISDWSSDVCSSDLGDAVLGLRLRQQLAATALARREHRQHLPAVLWRALRGRRHRSCGRRSRCALGHHHHDHLVREARVTLEVLRLDAKLMAAGAERLLRSEEHTSELQSLMRISYAVF